MFAVKVEKTDPLAGYRYLSLRLNALLTIIAFIKMADGVVILGGRNDGQAPQNIPSLLFYILLFKLR